MKKIIGFSCFLLVLSLTIGASVASAANNAKERKPLPPPESQVVDTPINDTRATTTTITFSYQDATLGTINRSAVVHLPPNYLHRGAMPLVLNFHGGSSNANAQMLYTGMNAVADEQGFAVVYPEGIDQSWNAIIPSPAAQRKVDDFGFAQELIRRLKSTYQIDSTRVYATGISNGAQMAYTLGFPDATQLPRANQRIAALGLVAVGLGPNQATFPRTDGPATIVFQGTADTRIPYTGGVGSGAIPFPYLPVWEGLVPVLLQNLKDFSTPTNVYPYYDQSFTPAPDVKINVWQSSSYNDPARFFFVELIGGGHTWPGGDVSITSDQTLGPTNQSVSASRMMAQFFAQHQLITSAPSLASSIKDVGLAGVNVAVKGNTYTITWRSTNVNKKVAILWAKKNISKGKWESVTGYITTKGKPVPNVGSYSWAIPTSPVDIYPIKTGATPTSGVIPDGDDYIIQVFATDSNGNPINPIGTSPAFSIVTRQQVSPDPVSNQSAVIGSFSGNLKAWFQRLLGR